MGVCNCSMFCCTLLYVNSSIAIILMGNYFNEKSPETNIYLCSLCPRVDTLVSDINEIIKEYVMIIRVLTLMCIKSF